MQLCVILFVYMNKCKRNIEDIKSDISRFLESGINNGDFTQASIAKAIRVNQSTISRYHNGAFRSVGKGVKKLCEYANISLYREVSPDSKGLKLLNEVVLDAWDGTITHAQRLSKAIKLIDKITHI